MLNPLNSGTNSMFYIRKYKTNTLYINMYTVKNCYLNHEQNKMEILAVKTLGKCSCQIFGYLISVIRPLSTKCLTKKRP